MAQTTIDCFITPEELDHVIARFCLEERLILLEVKRLGIGGDRRCVTRARASGVLPVLSRETAASAEELLCIEVTPAEWGAVSILAPRLEDGKLELCYIGARNDWLEDDQIVENPNGLDTAKLLKRRIQKLLMGTTMVTSFEGPERSRGTRRGPKYTAGSLQWVKDGNKLVYRIKKGPDFSPRRSIVPDILFDPVEVARELGGPSPAS